MNNKKIRGIIFGINLNICLHGYSKLERSDMSFFENLAYKIKTIFGVRFSKESISDTHRKIVIGALYQLNYLRLLNPIRQISFWMIDLPNIFLHHLTDKTIKNKNKTENITDKTIKNKNKTENITDKIIKNKNKTENITDKIIKNKNKTENITDKIIKNKNKTENITDKTIKKAKSLTVKIITLIKFSHEITATTCRNILNVLANPIHALILIFKKTTTKNNQVKEKTTNLPIKNKKNTGGNISSRNTFMKNQIKTNDIINFFNSSPYFKNKKYPQCKKISKSKIPFNTSAFQYK